jgi:threonine aldolase
VLSGVTFRPVVGTSGVLSGAQVSAALERHPYDVTVVDLVAIENTHQVSGGTPATVAEVASVAGACGAAGVPLYLDGARIFNACTVTGAVVADYAAHVTAMMFCLSKGLGAPIGSILVGDEEFIEEARRLKVLFGAAWRQAGIMAAAGLIALEEGPSRLAEDHENAQVLARGIAELLPGSVDPAAVPTNIVFVNVAGTGRGPAEWAARLAAEGLLVTMVSGKVRMLTHRDASKTDIETALAAWRRAAA